MNLTLSTNHGRTRTAQEALLLALIITSSVIASGHMRHPTHGLYPSGVCHCRRLRHLFAWISIGFWEAMADSLRWPGAWIVSPSPSALKGLTLEGTGARTAILIPVPMRTGRVFAGIKATTSLWRAPARSGISTSLSSVTRATLTVGRRRDRVGRDCALLGFQPIFYRRRR